MQQQQQPSAAAAGTSMPAMTPVLDLLEAFAGGDGESCSEGRGAGETSVAIRPAWSVK